MHQPLARVVLAHGCFDLLHLGHIRHLREAKALGDRLVVSVTADRYVSKGIGRPRFTAEQRLESILALECVDEGFISFSPDAVSAINTVKPSVFVKGIDYANGGDFALKQEIAAVEKHGGKFITTKSEKWSSSRLINGETLPEAVTGYLDAARSRGFLAKIVDAFEKADKLNIAFVGETIVDEYRYGQAIGKPSKEPCLATVEIDSEWFRGGVAAASLHGEWPKKKTITAEQKLYKTRYVDKDFSRKLFEVYSAQRLSFTLQGRKEIYSKIDEVIKAADVVVVLDFGHGLLDELARDQLRNAKFLAINAQSNAGNYGFNPVTKYKYADLICVDDPEARLAIKDQFGKAEVLITLFPARNTIITHGSQPTVAFDGQKISRIPVFSSHGIDTMGAGDAFLAVMAPLVAVGLEL